MKSVKLETIQNMVLGIDKVLEDLYKSLEVNEVEDDASFIKGKIKEVVEIKKGLIEEYIKTEADNHIKNLK